MKNGLIENNTNLSVMLLLFGLRCFNIIAVKSLALYTGEERAGLLSKTNKKKFIRKGTVCMEIR